MNRKSLLLLVLGLAIIGSGAGLITQLRAGQRLGTPGVKTVPVPDSVRLEVVLPEKVLDYESEKVDQEPLVLDTLPADTSFGQRRYTAPDRFTVLMNVVLMGSDRTSLHKPEFCLSGFGWKIQSGQTREDRVRTAAGFEIPVMRFVATKDAVVNNQWMTASGVYVFWFVEEEKMTAHHWQRMWWMAESLLRTGKLQRWAYISVFSACNPGQEEATYARMKEFIASAAPGFQLAGADGAGSGAGPLAGRP